MEIIIEDLIYDDSIKKIIKKIKYKKKELIITLENIEVVEIKGEEVKIRVSEEIIKNIIEIDNMIYKKTKREGIRYKGIKEKIDKECRTIRVEKSEYVKVEKEVSEYKKISLYISHIEATKDCIITKEYVVRMS